LVGEHRDAPTGPRREASVQIGEQHRRPLVQVEAEPFDEASGPSTRPGPPHARQGIENFATQLRAQPDHRNIMADLTPNVAQPAERRMVHLGDRLRFVLLSCYRTRSATTMLWSDGRAGSTTFITFWYLLKLWPPLTMTTSSATWRPLALALSVPFQWLTVGY